MQQHPFLSKEHLKNILQDILFSQTQHKTANSGQPDSDKNSKKLNQQQQQRLKQKLAHLHAADIAHILEGMPKNDRIAIWTQIPAEQHGKILLSLSSPVRNSILQELPIDDMVTAADKLPCEEISNLATLAQSLPDQAVDQILKSLTATQRLQFEDALSFPAGSVGSLMDFSMLTARQEDTVQDILNYCRKLSVLPEHSHHIYIVDEQNTLLGIIPLQKLIAQPFDKKAGTVMNRSIISFMTNDDAEQATFAFNRYKLTAAPVVDENNKLIGRICIDDIVDFMTESSEQQMLHQIGIVAGEDRFSGIWTGAKNRWLWLIITLLTAFIATRVIAIFEDKIVELVILATLMTVVTATAGNIGNQSCTLIIRSLALGQITDHNIRQFYNKEVGISLINGLLLGSLMGIFIGNIYGSGIGLIMGTSILINFFCTSFIAVSIPFFRHKYKLDPAMGSHVLVTFFADAFGFLVFLGLATTFL